MKRCPQCGQSYNDGSLNFCLLDGAPLESFDSEATIVIPAGAPIKARKSNALLWIGGSVAATLLLVIVAAGVFLIYQRSQQDQTTRGNRPPGSNHVPTPKASATPKRTPSPAASPTDDTPADDDDSGRGSGDGDSEEITPIAWNTAAIGFTGEDGHVFKFQCPENGTASAIWGSDIYTHDSSICTAAVHAGVITLEDGGVVTVEYRPGRSIYGSTVRNGITSNTFGAYPHSFVVR